MVRLIFLFFTFRLISLLRVHVPFFPSFVFVISITCNKINNSKKKFRFRDISFNWISLSCKQLHNTQCNTYYHYDFILIFVLFPIQNVLSWITPLYMNGVCSTLIMSMCWPYSCAVSYRFFNDSLRTSIVYLSACLSCF